LIKIRLTQYTKSSLLVSLDIFDIAFSKESNRFLKTLFRKMQNMLIFLTRPESLCLLHFTDYKHLQTALTEYYTDRTWMCPHLCIVDWSTRLV